MTDNINEIKKIMVDINDKGYFDKYGGSFLLVFIVLNNIYLNFLINHNWFQHPKFKRNDL